MSLFKVKLIVVVVVVVVSEAVVESVKKGHPNLDDETLRLIKQVMVAPHKHKHRKLRKSHAGQQQGMSCPSLTLSLSLSLSLSQLQKTYSPAPPTVVQSLDTLPEVFSPQKLLGA